MKLPKFKLLKLLSFSFVILFAGLTLSLKSKPEIVENKAIWFDLVSPDLSKATKFYSQVFGWTFKESNIKGVKNSLIMNGNDVIGSIYEIPKAEVSVWIAAAETSNSDLTEKTKSLIKKGAKLAIGPFNLSERGTVVIFEGIQGEEFSLIADNEYVKNSNKSSSNGSWFGAELWATDEGLAKTFYENAFNVSLQKQDFNGKPYWFFEKNGQKIAGMIKNPIENQGTRWVPYVNSNDITGVISMVKKLGGKVILDPNPSIREGKIAIVQDPNGAIFCIHSIK